MARALTAEDITLATGETDHARLVTIEIIFGVFEAIGGLDGCVNLCSLTLLNCRLQRISQLAPVSLTLTRLCLSDQELTRIEGLALPNLRQLLLDRNRIRVIENLDGCPKLQKLWLSHNCLTTIANLSACADLRELWLQNNQIQKLGDGLTKLTHLHSLALGGNGLSDFADLATLSHLPNLCSLSLDDAHYGANPITRAKGYRTYILNQLPQVRVLDGLEVAAKDQHAAEDAYFKRVLAFNDRIDAIQQDHERALSTIDSRRHRNQSHADVLQHELLAAFTTLEKSVQKGRAAIAAEETRQALLREKHATALQHTLEALHAEYTAHVDMVLRRETEAAAHTDAMFEILDARIAAEEEHAIAVAAAQAAYPHYAFHRVPVASPECRCLAALFAAPPQTTPEADDVKVLQVYRCQGPGCAPAPAPSDLLFGVVHELVAPTTTPLVLCATPWLAMACHDRMSPRSARRHRHVLLAKAPTTIATVIEWRDVASIDDLPTAIASLDLPRDSNAWVQVHYQIGNQQGRAYCLAPGGNALVEAAPEYYCTTFATPAAMSEADLEALMASTLPEPALETADMMDGDLTLLDGYDGRLQSALAAYTEALWADVGPRAKAKEPDDRKRVAKLQASIQHEQETQKATLRQQLHKSTKR
ncbi:hypothetical protein SDRG_12847 [Saprolegnia diclina VS20]|uniref:U2A'/phosphoprotein 32 family A C-terminal domain-containing protein n=1 Tax=Saprolegnia diclina (strain VS20) TaxID=1156394 RepID=T0PV56_SAPDV|nr:hypothetical protein SDRG_12847 [Saprolegnia diclina VS20]EQC29384.1 hypothetical protein SDRG_12847 [Saprolegnia diclina VS20]|eukprot:XP_008617151.1 hypothetical protein SDRG_12847 [Saprolegnia diclina VS20]